MYARQSVRLGAWAWGPYGHLPQCQPAKKLRKTSDPWEGEGSRAPTWAEFPGTPTYTYVPLRTRTYTYVHVCTRTYTNVHICTRTYAHVHIRTRTYARTCTYTYVRVPWDSPQPGTPLTRGSEFFFFAGWLAGGARWPGWQCWLAVPLWQCPYCQEYQ